MRDGPGSGLVARPVGDPVRGRSPSSVARATMRIRSPRPKSDAFVGDVAAEDAGAEWSNSAAGVSSGGECRWFGRSSSRRCAAALISTRSIPRHRSRTSSWRESSFERRSRRSARNRRAALRSMKDARRPPSFERDRSVDRAGADCSPSVIGSRPSGSRIPSTRSKPTRNGRNPLGVPAVVSRVLPECVNGRVIDRRRSSVGTIVRT